ncbi:hypothetical protein KM043_016546 [Ampulex compressa]|nr:hypothetical protein KM043_016546 [Ampulex compressa]
MARPLDVDLTIETDAKIDAADRAVNPGRNPAAVLGGQKGKWSDLGVALRLLLTGPGNSRYGPRVSFQFAAISARDWSRGCVAPIGAGLPRATLAEKEVSALKEQLAAANDSNSKTEGHQLPQTPQGSEQQQVHDASNLRRTPNSNLEQELQAKDKEVECEEAVKYPTVRTVLNSPKRWAEGARWPSIRTPDTRGEAVGAEMPSVTPTLSSDTRRKSDGGLAGAEGLVELRVSQEAEEAATVAGSVRGCLLMLPHPRAEG